MLYQNFRLLQKLDTKARENTTSRRLGVGRALSLKSVIVFRYLIFNEALAEAFVAHGDCIQYPLRKTFSALLAIQGQKASYGPETLDVLYLRAIRVKATFSFVTLIFS